MMWLVGLRFGRGRRGLPLRLVAIGSGFAVLMGAGFWLAGSAPSASASGQRIQDLAAPELAPYFAGYRSFQWSVSATEPADSGAFQFYVEYGVTSGYGGVACSQSEASAGTYTETCGTPPEAFTSPGTVFHARGAVINDTTTVFGPDQTFTTQAGEPPAFSGFGNFQWNGFSGDLAGESFSFGVNTGGYDTTWQIDYGVTPSLGSSMPAKVTQDDDHVGVFTQAQGFVQPVQLGTVYYFKVVGTNQAGTVESPVMTFTSGGTPPTTTGTTTTTSTTTNSTTTTTATTPTTSAATTTTAQTTTAATTTAVTTTTPTPPASGLILPRRSLTPGVTNPTVRQATLRSTICVSGWTKTVRPPASYTDALKLRQMRQYKETGKPSAYEEDNLIPIELGGAPRNPKNLWPEPHSQSTHSDPLETTLKRKVCSGSLTLAAARGQILAFKRTHG